MTGLTDEEAIASLRAGNSSAFRILYERYASRGLSYANAILHNKTDAEEALQEVFCRLLTPIRNGSVDPERGGFRALFFGSLRNLSIDMLRRRRQAGHLSLEAVAEPINRAGGKVEERVDEKSSASQEVAEKIRAAFMVLPANHAEALQLRLNGGLSYDQIAGVLGCTRAQVRTWIYRARRRLEEIFTRDGLIQPRTAASAKKAASAAKE
jgi:RNA polymerase sigma-70 factor (ECF subfamily)